MKTKYRVLIIFVLIESLIPILTGCQCRFLTHTKTIYREGIENYDRSMSEMSLTWCLLPSVDYLEKYPFEDANYFYKEDYNPYRFVSHIERTMIVCNYDESVYEEAKAFCLKEMDLSDSNRMEYNGYVYIENTRMTDLAKFPEWFNVVSFNDANHCIIFLGFTESDSFKGYEENMQLAQEDWGTFLVNNFGEFYDFNK